MNFTSWKRLGKVAMGLLGVSADSTSPERAFSVAGLTLDDRRTQPRPETVDGLLFVHVLETI